VREWKAKNVVDQDAEQLKDETDEEWVKAWRKVVKAEKQ